MGRIVSPARNEIHQLRTPLQPGEQIVLDLFEEFLSDDWEIYVQPHLNGCRPDLVVLNPNSGIGVFEVKDWNFDALRYDIQEAAGGQSNLSAQRNGKSFVLENPLKKVQRYKHEIFELYCPRLDSRNGLATITAGVIFPFANRNQIKSFVYPLSAGLRLFSQYDPISCAEDIDAKNIGRVFPESRRLSSSYMSDELADDLRSWLIEPDYSAEQRLPLELDLAQTQLVETRTESGYRRIRGPAGSGKSLVLAARAAKLAAEGKEVLVVSFNITLLHYLRDLSARWPEGKSNDITWLNYHEWCKRMAEEMNLDDRYKELWRDHFENGLPNDTNPTKVFSSDIPQLIISGFNDGQQADFQKFDAIFVDEGQDFYPLWWETLRKVCRPGGELLLAADMTQDVYGTGSRWTDEAMTGAGFRGPWSELDASYRLPNKILRYATSFAKTFLPIENCLPPKPDPKQSELELYPCELKWLQIQRNDSVDACVEELFKLIREDENGDRAIPDLTLLTDNKDDGASIVQKLMNLGVNVVHTFARPKSGEQRQWNEDRRKKLGFWKGDARIKLTTLHSFKGWEGRLIVLNITHAKSRQDFALIYTGLTRLKRHVLGSCMTVVCSEPTLAEFGAQWRHSS